MTALGELIATHRALYRDELERPFRVNITEVPAETTAIGVAEYDGSEWRPGPETIEVTDSGPLGGPPFSPPMNRHLGPVAAYGAQRPWSFSLFALRKACRTDHPGHTERRTFGGALCWQATAYAIRQEYAVDTVARVLSEPPDFLIEGESVERHLLRSLRWIEEHMDRGQQIRNARDPQPSEEPTPTRISLLQCDAANRAVQDFDLEQRIWNSQREIQARHGVELVPWEEEWQRRQQVLWDHQATCDRCRRAA